MKIKTETNFGDTAPQIIKARLWSIESPLVEFKLQGKGAYPCDCQDAVKCPNAYIYISESGGWVGSYQLNIQPDGSYIIKCEHVKLLENVQQTFPRIGPL